MQDPQHADKTVDAAAMTETETPMDADPLLAEVTQ